MSTRQRENDIHGYKIFTKRVGLNAIARTIFQFKGLIILPILTKNLATSDYGIWTQILVTILLLQPFVSLGLGNSAIRFLSSKNKREIGQGILTVLSVTFVIGMIVTLVVFFSADLFARNLLKEASAIPAIRVGSILIILDALISMALGSFRIFGQIKRYSIIMLLEAILEIVLIAVAVLSGYGLLGAIISLLITKTVILLVILYFIISYAGFSFPDFSIIRPYLAYGLPMMPTALFELIIASSDRYVIGFFMGAASVGIYGASYNIGSITAMFMSFITYILAPTIFKLFDKGEISEVRSYLSYSWKYVMMLAIPSVFGLSILAGQLLSSLTTTEFISTGKFIVPLISLSMILNVMYGILGLVVRLSRRTVIFAITLSVAAALNLGLNVVLIPYWGVIAAAITTIAAYALAAIIMYKQANRIVKFDMKPGFILKSVLSSLLMTTVIWLINPVGMVNILLSVALGVIIYFTILFLLKGFNRNEVKFFYKLLKETLVWTQTK